MDEFDRVQGRRPAAVPVGVVPPAEGHTPLLQRQEAPMRDGDPMGRAGEVLEHVRWLVHRTLGVDHPLVLAELLHQTLPGLRLGQGLAGAGQGQGLGGPGLGEPCQEAAPKEAT